MKHDIQNNNPQHNGIWYIMLLCWLSFMPTVTYADCHLCWLSFMLTVIYAKCCKKPFMLSVVMLNTVVPYDKFWPFRIFIVNDSPHNLSSYTITYGQQGSISVSAYSQIFSQLLKGVFEIIIASFNVSFQVASG